MDLFKLGMRNFFGIVLPGAILLLVIAYAFFTVTSIFGWMLFNSSWVKDRQSLSVIALFLLSYLLGSLMRLNSAEKLDKKSGRLLQKRHMREKGLSRKACEERTEEAWKMLQPDPSQVDPPRADLLEGTWEFDTFPYPIWQFWRLRLYRPKEAYIFFWQYKDCLRQNRISGKSFFNYCKTVLYYERKEAGDLLVAEVQSLEAEVRFFAGTYYALSAGVWITCVSFLTQLAVTRLPLSLNPGVLALLLTALLLTTMYMMKRAILKRFRTLRIKEVDTLLDAFYLVHRHDPECPKCLEGS